MFDDQDLEHAGRITEVDGLMVAAVAPDLGVEGLRRFTQVVLARLADVRERAVILDFSSVLVIDSHEFGEIVQLARMGRLLGARVFVAALNPGIASHLALTLAEPPPLKFCRDLEHARALARGPAA